MKQLWIITVFLLVVACETDSKQESFPENMTLNTEDITAYGHYFNFTDRTFNDPYDISFSAGQNGYLVKLNSRAGVRAMKADSMDFASAVPAMAPYAGDSSATGYYVIGGTWMDESTYNPQDHSLQGNGSVWFIRTTDYGIVKFEVLWANPDSIHFRYAFQNDTGFDPEQAKAMAFHETEDTEFDFTTGDSPVTTSWDIAFYTLPVFVPEMGNLFMPHVALGNQVQVALVTEGNFDDMVAVPEGLEWLRDTDDSSVLGYMGRYMVLVYHPEPPYNHKVIVENPGYIYFIQTETALYRFRFDDYGSGALIFTFAPMEN